MKQFFYSVLLMAVALFGASTFVSCGSSDDDPVAPVPQGESKKFVTYLVKVPEDYFSFGDVVVTIEADGKKTVKKLSDTPKVDNLDWDLMDSFSGSNKAGRVLSLPEIQFESNPVKVTTEFLLSDAGKQKIANATGDEEAIFGFYLECAEYSRWSDGDKSYTSDYGYPGPGLKVVQIAPSSVYVKDYENNLNLLKDGFKNEFNRTFKDI